MAAPSSQRQQPRCHISQAKGGGATSLFPLQISACIGLIFDHLRFQCDAGVATYKMFDQLYQPPTEIMVLGCGCSIESEATAQVSHLFNITQVSHVRAMCGSRGGTRGPDPPHPPPKKNHKNIEVLSNSGPDPLKVTRLPNQHSMLAIIRTPAKRHLNGVSLAGR